jgi:anion-transporting  ArsA/GET3 family ATPase
MRSLIERRLLVVTGKGGVGKTTVAAALALWAARAGRRTILVEVGRESRLPPLFDRRTPQLGSECELAENLSSVTIDPDRALLEWLQLLGGRVSGRVLASSGTFQYFAAAAPGASELVTMVKIWQLTGGREERRATGHDLVVLDAPATGHALGLLASPHTFGAIARVGPIAGHTRRVSELLESEQRSAYVAVAQGTEMAVTETLELDQGLRRRLGVGLSLVALNALLPERFTAAELARVASLSGAAPAGAGHAPSRERHAPERGAAEAAIASARAAARAVHDRARFQHNQLARLRRRGFEVVGVPFVWQPQIDLAAVGAIAERFARRG